MGDKTSAVTIIILFLLFTVLTVFLVVFFIKLHIPKSDTNRPTRTNIFLTTSTSTINLKEHTTTKKEELIRE